MKSQMTTERRRDWHSSSGRSLVETLIVVAIAAVLASVTLPQIISARRLIRSSALPRQIATQLRFTRQKAMSQRQAFTFQYDDATKEITIYDHNNEQNANAACNIAGTQLFVVANFPNTSCSTVALTVPLAGTSGLPVSEVSFGVPTGLSTPTLTDTTTPTALAGGKITITFQPNGTVVDGSNNAVNTALFFYNNQAAYQTASAISVLGTAGRVKVWRYDTSASQFAE